MRTAIKAHVNLWIIQCSTVPACTVVEVLIKKNGVREVYHGVSEGQGVREVYHGVRKVYHGVNH